MHSLRVIIAMLLAIALAGCPAPVQPPKRAPEQTPKTQVPVPTIPSKQTPPKSWTMPAAQPKQIALLLPLSGRQQAAGIAVRDGFLSAWFRQDLSKRPRVRIYDITGQDVGGSLLRAIDEGAQFIVGPLTKDEVAAAAGIADGRAPVLALNFLADGGIAPYGFFQFALAPDDEARQVARRVVADGRPRGVALVPSGEWGTRLLTAFADELLIHGGRLVAQGTYNPAESDYSAAIQQLFRLSDSRERHARLTAMLGTKLEFEPRRRGDIGFVFVAAQPEQGRLIRPQLKFHYAGDVPMYTTSEVFEPNEAANADLDGVMFPDMPWMLSDDAAAATVRTSIESAWPARAARRGRLYAFGADACRLIPALIERLRKGTGGTNAAIEGLTGRLTIDAEGRVHRDLDWANIRDGKPVALGIKQTSAP